MTITANGKTYEGSAMTNGDGIYQRNQDETSSEAIPLPIYGIKKRCSCGRSFWFEKNYETHYVATHTDKKHYDRSVKGLAEKAHE